MVGHDVALHRKKEFLRSRQSRQNYLSPAVSKETKLLNSSGERLPTGRIVLDQWAFLFSVVEVPESIRPEVSTKLVAVL